MSKRSTQPAVSAVQKIKSISKARFSSTVKKSDNASEVLRKLGIYTNGRNVEAVRSRASSERVAFAK